MSDSDEEKVERVKKPRTPAQMAAVEKMLEGRRKALALRKEEKEKEKEDKKMLKKQIKKKVIEETNMLNKLSPSELEDLRQNALGKIDKVVNTHLEEVKEEEIKIKEDPDYDPPTPKHRRKQNTPKKKVVVNNYYDVESSSEEEEEVNNYYKKKKKKMSVKKLKKTARRPTKEIESSSSEEESDIETEELQPPPYNSQSVPFNPMGDIIFR
tara:strand:+ start:7679 stop:8311 length:633 start_codon:yes stop_codon:yes gene_type:complete